MKCYSRGPIVDAEQFLGPDQPIPKGMRLWSTMEYQPRDGSWGFIGDERNSINIHHGDWILTMPDGRQVRVTNDTFHKSFVEARICDQCLGAGSYPLPTRQLCNRCQGRRYL